MAIPFNTNKLIRIFYLKYHSKNLEIIVDVNLWSRMARAICRLGRERTGDLRGSNVHNPLMGIYTAELVGNDRQGGRLIPTLSFYA
jgi:hypothetical protein